MAERLQLVVFRLDEQRYAVRLAVVERSVRAVEVTNLPHAPALVLGVIDVAGRVFPVLNLRRRLKLPERALEVSDQFLIARTARHTVALVVDETLGVVDLPPTGIVASTRIAPGIAPIEGVAKLPDGLVLIHNLDSFLCLDEEAVLDAALRWEVTP